MNGEEIPGYAQDGQIQVRDYRFQTKEGIEAQGEAAPKAVLDFLIRYLNWI